MEASSNELNPEALRKAGGERTTAAGLDTPAVHPALPPRPQLRGPQSPTLVHATGGHDAEPTSQRGASGGAEPWTLPMGDGAEPLGPARLGYRRIAAAAPSSRAPLRPGRGLRHVPWPAGAAAATAASVRGFRGRRSAPPAALVRILGRGRRPVASPGPRAPACPEGPALAHSVPDHRLPSADAEEGRGGGAASHEDTGDQSERARATAAAPPPGRAAPPPSRVGGAGRSQLDAPSWGSRAFTALSSFAVRWWKEQTVCL